MPTQFESYPRQPKSKETLHGYWILYSTHDAASSLLDLFGKAYTDRGARGAPTDEEQDLLRAMLVFACSGLDSMAKQLIRDALPAVVNKDTGAHAMFQQYIERELKRGDQLNPSLLASALADPSPRSVLLDSLVATLTVGSLQSKEELLKAASFFASSAESVGKFQP